MAAEDWEKSALYVMNTLNSLLEAGKEVGRAVADLDTKQQLNKSQIEDIKKEVDKMCEATNKKVEDLQKLLTKKIEDHIAETRSKESLKTSTKAVIWAAIITSVISLIGVIITIIL